MGMGRGVTSGPCVWGERLWWDGQGAVAARLACRAAREPVTPYSHAARCHAAQQLQQQQQVLTTAPAAHAG